jgi:hypothetical protein
MNKTQKKNLVLARRFTQKINKIVNKLVLVDIETSSDLDPADMGRTINYIPNKPLIQKLTMKEIEYILDMDAMKAEGYNQELVGMLHNEYAERKLLLERGK